MATQGERIEALEAGLKELQEAAAERAKADGEKLTELEGKVADLTKALADDTAKLLDGAPDVPAVTGDAREELLKVHRQLETVANHLNIRLPG